MEKEYRRLMAASVAAYEAGDNEAGLEFEKAADALAVRAILGCLKAWGV